MSINQTAKQLLQCIAILLVILMTTVTMSSCSKDETPVSSFEPEDQKGVLEVNFTNFELEPGQDYARLIATYKSPKGLYEPEAIKIHCDKIEILGILDGNNKLFDLPYGTYTVTAGELSITVVVKTTPYSNLPAKFIFENAYRAPALFTACNSIGEFCTITYSKDGKQFVFKGSAKEPSYVNLTAIAGYTGFRLGLSGLIVGLPNIPEIGKTESQVVCFDLACSNCYNDYNITKPLIVTEGTATCNSCKRTYDLNNTGFITKGEAGKPLFRYRVSYENDLLKIYNEYKE